MIWVRCMEIINRIRNYLLEEEFGIQLYPDKVDVVNYKRIGHFDSEKVMIDYDLGTLVIKGERLVVSKLLQEEVLVTGIIKSVELR